jgi:mRNA interferase MazF
MFNQFPGFEYVPERGDIVEIDFDPQVGYEQAKRRPALILSADQYNKRMGLAILCPITTKNKGFPWSVKIPDGLPVVGLVLSHQIKSFDWRERQAKFLCKLPPNCNVLEEVQEKFLTIFEE